MHVSRTGGTKRNAHESAPSLAGARIQSITDGGGAMMTGRKTEYLPKAVRRAYYTHAHRAYTYTTRDVTDDILTLPNLWTSARPRSTHVAEQKTK